MEGRTRIAAVALVALAVVVGLLALAWNASERHYENCLAEVELRYGSEPRANPNVYAEASGERSAPTLEELDDETEWLGARNGAISRCSRWP